MFQSRFSPVLQQGLLASTHTALNVLVRNIFNFRKILINLIQVKFKVGKYVHTYKHLMTFDSVKALIYENSELRDFRVYL